MADLLDVMNKLRIKNKTIQEDLNQYKQNIAELKDQIVKDAKTNRKLQENRGLAEAAGGFNVRGNKVFKENELHVKNLEIWVDNEELMNQFKRFGTVSEVRVTRDNQDRSKGFAFLCFNTPGEATRAMAAMNGATIGTKMISVSLVELKPGQKAHVNKQYAKDKIFVKNLLSDIEDEELKALFSKFGGIVDAKVLRDEAGKSKGVAFLQFYSTKSAERAVLEMNGRSIKHIPAFVSFAELKPGRTPTNPFQPATTLAKDKIFVSNLPTNFTHHELRALFSRFGEISSARCVADKHIGFVQFIFAKDAEATVKAMNGHVLDSRILKVTLAKNRPGQTSDPFYAPRKATPTYQRDVYEDYSYFD